jgi:hypothetical protein
MRLHIPTQLIVAFVITVIGAGALGGEYVLVKWWPIHQQNVIAAVQNPLPYRNDSLGIDSMQVAAGIYGKVASSPGGVRIYRPKFLGEGPSLTITSQPNPDGADDFSPQLLAEWEASGAIQGIPRYRFEHTQVNGHNAAFVWQLNRKNQMVLTGHLISPTHILQAECTPGMEDEETYMQACDAALHSIKLSGRTLAPPEEPQIYDLSRHH